jgi:hypothetical protein
MKCQLRIDADLRKEEVIAICLYTGMLSLCFWVGVTGYVKGQVQCLGRAATHMSCVLLTHRCRAHVHGL